MLKKALATQMAIQMASATSQTIKGYIYADNWFEFYFNGQLIKTDPLTFTPHQAVEVEFEWDGVSDRQYAFKASDYASTSGYEYTDTTSPKLGDGAFIAWFSDGTKTTGDWKIFTTSFGPTDASITNGCSASNLAACAIQTTAEPTDWTKSTFDDSSWSKATTYTESQAGWGRSPDFWYGLFGVCAQSTSPFTRNNLDFTTGNVDANGNAVEVIVDAKDCLDPQDVFSDLVSDGGVQFLWGSDLERDNEILLRFNAGNQAFEALAASYLQGIMAASILA